jgi:glucose-6-phosphate isomerase
MVNLTHHSGFFLHFDPLTLQIQSGDGLKFKRTTRYGREVKDVLCFPDGVKPDEPVYMMDILSQAPAEIQTALDRFRLTYSLVIMPPGKIGREFVKTTGHYHPPIPGTNLGYPEVYTQLFGNLFLVLQRRSGTNPHKIIDYRIVEMTPGFVITIPPNYAHCLVNATEEPALMAGLYGKDFKADYTLTRTRHGLAYYLLNGGNGKPNLLPNLNYPEHPEANWMHSIENTCFAPDFPDQPVWSSFVQNPGAFAFLTEGQAAKMKFPNWD